MSEVQEKLLSLLEQMSRSGQTGHRLGARSGDISAAMTSHRHKGQYLDRGYHSIDDQWEHLLRGIDDSSDTLRGGHDVVNTVNNYLHISIFFKTRIKYQLYVFNMTNWLNDEPWYNQGE